MFPNHHKKKILPTNKIKRYLSMIEASRPEPAIKEEKLKFFISKITIWYYFNIPEATCKAYLVDEKSRLLTKYYSELFQKYYGSGKSQFFCSLLHFGRCNFLPASEHLWSFGFLFFSDFSNTDHYWYYGEACSSRTNRVPQEQIFVIEATLLENHFLPSSGFVMLMSVEDVLISQFL